ncbi:MAG: hypothetical protein KGZ75_07835 [Syntrophomonadaceae bacterium]|nr:hypothetical protein [Syntrophomonadaceae bacterium]
MAKISMVMVLVAMMMVAMVPQAGAGDSKNQDVYTQWVDEIGARANARGLEVVVADGDDLFYRLQGVVERGGVIVRHDTDPATVKVEVVDAASGRPIPGALVVFSATHSVSSRKDEGPSVAVVGFKAAGKLPLTCYAGTTKINNLYFVSYDLTGTGWAQMGQRGTVRRGPGLTNIWLASGAGGQMVVSQLTVEKFGLQSILPAGPITEDALAEIVMSNKDKLAQIFYDAYFTEPRPTLKGEIVFEDRAGVEVVRMDGSRRTEPPVRVAEFRLWTEDKAWINNKELAHKALAFDYQVWAAHPDYRSGTVERVAVERGEPIRMAVSKAPTLSNRNLNMRIYLSRSEPPSLEPTAGHPRDGKGGAQGDTEALTPGVGGGSEQGAGTGQGREQAKGNGNPAWPIALAGAAGLGMGLLPIIILYRRRKKVKK